MPPSRGPVRQPLTMRTERQTMAEYNDSPEVADKPATLPAPPLNVPLLIWSFVLIVVGLVVIIYAFIPNAPISILFIGMLVLLGCLLLAAALVNARKNKS